MVDMPGGHHEISWPFVSISGHWGASAVRGALAHRWSGASPTMPKIWIRGKRTSVYRLRAELGDPSFGYGMVVSIPPEG